MLDPVAVERVELAGSAHDPEQGFSPAALRITRTDGPRWSHGGSRVTKPEARDFSRE